MKIKSIQKVEPRTVYAITTSTNTFVSDGLAHHNCRRCNHFLDGAQDKAAYYVIQKYGLHNFQALIHTDYAWLAGKLKKPSREQIVRYYNYWLAINRETEKRWNIKLIPASWEPSEG